MFQEAITNVLKDYRHLVEKTLEDPSQKDQALSCLEEALNDVLVHRKSKYKLLGGTEELPDELEFLRFEGNCCYVGNNPKNSYVNSGLTKALLYFLEYEEETFRPDEISEINGCSEHRVSASIDRYRVKLDESIISSHTIFTEEHNPTKYGLRKKDKSQRINRNKKRAQKVVEHYRIKLRHNETVIKDEALSELEGLLEESLDKRKITSRYKIFDGTEELPDCLYGIVFKEGKYYIRGTEEKRTPNYKTYGRLSSGSGRILVYMLENIDKTFSTEEIAKITGGYNARIRVTMNNIKYKLKTWSTQVEIFTEGHNPTRYGIREKVKQTNAA